MWLYLFFVKFLFFEKVGNTVLLEFSKELGYAHHSDLNIGRDECEFQIVKAPNLGQIDTEL